MFVPRAKNDVYREGNKVYIKRLVNKYCPVALLHPLLVTAPVYQNVYLNYTVAGSRTVLKTCMSLKTYLSV